MGSEETTPLKVLLAVIAVALCLFVIGISYMFIPAKSLRSNSITQTTVAEETQVEEGTP